VMSAHIVVPSIDSAPATASPRVMQALLRDELGFQGLAITDGLEMRGFSGQGGIGEDAVRAMAAGCDALCIGGGLSDESVVDEIAAALQSAVERGRLAEHRLREAAARVDALAGWRLRQTPASRETGQPGLRAARKAIRITGQVRVGDDATVVRFPSAPSIAAGPVPWGLAGALASRGVRVAAHDADLAAHPAPAPSPASLVLVVRDLHRHPGQAAQVAAILRLRRDAVLVEMGIPLCRPAEADNYVATHGSARVCAEAAAELLHA
jgi:beta-N-acetylhexosaminidase